MGVARGNFSSICSRVEGLEANHWVWGGLRISIREFIHFKDGTLNRR